MNDANPGPLARLILGVVLVSANAAAEEQPEMTTLLESRGCTACHAMTEPGLGPPLIAVAARYRERREVMTEVLAQKILHGGAGNWGSFPMVANDSVLSVDEARSLARWILDLQASR